MTTSLHSIKLKY